MKINSKECSTPPSASPVVPPAGPGEYKGAGVMGHGCPRHPGYIIADPNGYHRVEVIRHADNDNERQTEK